MEEKLKDLKDVNFIFMDNMKQTLFDMMAIQKLLESEDLDYREQSSGSFYFKSKFKCKGFRQMKKWTKLLMFILLYPFNIFGNKK